MKTIKFSILNPQFSWITVLCAVSLCSFLSCESSIKKDPQRNWDADETYFASTDEQVTSTYYKPYSGYVGDPIPFFDPKSQSFKVLYLMDFRPHPVGVYHPIWGVETTDAANYTPINEVLPCGGINEQDAAIGTGSVVYDEESETYYLFYTGHRHLPQAGEPAEAVMYATSKDFKHWTKCKTFLLLGGDYGYSNVNFRDPFVLKMDDDKWHMIVSTNAGGKCVLAEFVSDNLQEWSSAGIFMTVEWGDRFYECPDIFKMGDWWYLVYSEQLAAIRRVQYFKGRTIEELKASKCGVWPDDHEGYLNSRAFYAGKTATDGTNRYIWGWCPTRDGKDNTATAPAPAEPNWGGTLVAHKVLQHQDGTLSLVEVPAMENKYNQHQSVQIKQQEPTYSLFGRLGYHNRISFSVQTATASDKFGVSFCRGSDSEKYYTLVFNPEGDARRKINFEEEGPDGVGFIPAIDSYLFDTPADNIYHITICTDNSVLTMYVNDILCYTNRIHGIARNCWSINNYGNDITISDIQLFTY